MRVVSFLLRLYCSTWKITRVEKYFSQLGESSIIAAWHGDIWSLLWMHRREEIVPIVSLSKDGQLLCSILKDWGYRNFIRGSSSKGGSQVLQKAYEEVQKGKKIAFAVDGPRGPRLSPKMGVLRFAMQTRSPILILMPKASSAYYLSSWDRFCVPMPFSKINIESFLWVPNEEWSIEEAQKELKKKMLWMSSCQSRPWDD